MRSHARLFAIGLRLQRKVNQMHLRSLLIIKTSLVLSGCASLMNEARPPVVFTPCLIDWEHDRLECTKGGDSPSIYYPLRESNNFVCYPPDNLPGLLR